MSVRGRSRSIDVTLFSIRYKRKDDDRRLCKEANFEDPLALVVAGRLSDLIVGVGWVRVMVPHSSLNRHDSFTLRGLGTDIADLLSTIGSGP